MAFTFSQVPANWAPVVGSGFDQDMGQLRSWAGFNAGVLEGNAARQAEAERVRNQYNLTAANMQQAAIDRNAQADTQADTQAQNAQAAAARAAQEQANIERQFSFAQRQEADRLALGREQIEASTDAAEERAATQKAQQDTKIEQDGQNAAATYLTVKKEADQAKEWLEDVREQIKESQDDQVSELAKPSKSRDAVKMTMLPQRIKELQKQATQLTTVANRAEIAFQATDTRIRNSGFDISDDAIIHRTSGKKWSFKSAARNAGEAYQDGAGLTGFTATPGSVADTLMNQAGPGAFSFGGAADTGDNETTTTDSGATTPQLPPPMKVGRFGVRIVNQ